MLRHHWVAFGVTLSFLFSLWFGRGIAKIRTRCFAIILQTPAANRVEDFSFAQEIPKFFRNSAHP
ncbi:hypothetical protein K440DRAFT_621578 [Wilcoxina mikolae CBS 423.85]|nr:hypothetical protein K440DRAFT_621578 [Wilcoxina mikolae CBS 423.85]